jgi:hypothetical protein
MSIRSKIVVSTMKHASNTVDESILVVDWAGFEPATSRLRSEHYYP